MTSITTISNRGLQELGAARILDITDDSRNGRACNACYDSLRKAELRKHYWRFALKRQVLSPLATAPAFDFLYQFQLPADCLRIIKPPTDLLDWEVEGRTILTNQSNVINLRYVADVTDPNQFDALFAEMLSMKMAEAMCEEVTQSNTKQAVVQAKYKDLFNTAKRTNAFETIPVVPVTDDYIFARGVF